MESNVSPIVLERKRSALLSVFRKVYVWMTLALCITGLTAMVVANNDRIIYELLQNNLLFWGIIIAEVALVFVISGMVSRLSMTTATLLFILYSVLNGVTMSLIFLAYTESTIASTFFITAGTFGALSLYGYMTKKDLSSWGSILGMALLGLIIASVVNIFMESDTLYWIFSYVGVLLFVGLTVYDTQKIKRAIMNPDNEIDDNLHKVALLGALSLYLDFINLFLYMLRIMGDRD